MKIKTYGLFDTVSEQFVRTFTAKNDADAIRSGKYIVREKEFDPIAGCDMVIYHLYDVETSDGKVSDNDCVPLVALKEAYEAYKEEQNAQTSN